LDFVPDLLSACGDANAFKNILRAIDWWVRLYRNQKMAWRERDRREKFLAYFLLPTSSLLHAVAAPAAALIPHISHQNSIPSDLDCSAEI
jgi:hypothetical protein